MVQIRGSAKVKVGRKRHMAAVLDRGKRGGYARVSTEVEGGWGANQARRLTETMGSKGSPGTAKPLSTEMVAISCHAKLTIPTLSKEPWGLHRCVGGW